MLPLFWKQTSKQCMMESEHGKTAALQALFCRDGSFHSKPSLSEILSTALTVLYAIIGVCVLCQRINQLGVSRLSCIKRIMACIVLVNRSTCWRKILTYERILCLCCQKIRYARSVTHQRFIILVA